MDLIPAYWEHKYLCKLTFKKATPAITRRTSENDQLRRCMASGELKDAALAVIALLAQRLSRNESEKLRRDRLNAYIGELAKVVPLVMQSDKKMDKASILRLTVTYLRIHHDLVKNTETDMKWKPDQLTMENLANLLLQCIDGFMLVLNQRGVMLYATEALNEYLGHQLVDVLGTSFFKLVHPEDVETLRKQFNFRNRDEDTEAGSGPSHVPVAGHRSFNIRILNRQNVTNNQQPPRYENVHIVGHLKKMDPIQASISHPGHLQNFPSNHSANDGLFQTVGVQPRPESEVCLVSVGRLIRRDPISLDLELAPDLESIPNQWVTRHELDGKITYSDQSAEEGPGLLEQQRANILKAYHGMEGRAHSAATLTEIAPDDNSETDTVTDEMQKKNSRKQRTYSTNSDDIIPDMEEISQDLVNVVVGEKRFKIELSRKDKFSPVLKVATVDNVPPVFDPYAQNDDGGSGIPFVMPRFLGGEEEEKLKLLSANSGDEGLRAQCMVTSSTSVSEEVRPALQQDMSSNLRELLGFSAKNTPTFAIGTQNPLQGVPAKTMQEEVSSTCPGNPSDEHSDTTPLDSSLALDYDILEQRMHSSHPDQIAFSSGPSGDMEWQLRRGVEEKRRQHEEELQAVRREFLSKAQCLSGGNTGSKQLLQLIMANDMLPTAHPAQESDGYPCQQQPSQQFLPSEMPYAPPTQYPYPLQQQPPHTQCSNGQPHTGSSSQAWPLQHDATPWSGHTSSQGAYPQHQQHHQQRQQQQYSGYHQQWNANPTIQQYCNGQQWPPYNDGLAPPLNQSSATMWADTPANAEQPQYTPAFLSSDLLYSQNQKM
ncbi:hypothetical protein CAPTEDRAFT_199895 [Capitella teleta]|uniref:Uncharacterized protein n=1 Tax=Capitella teleta TaxID=283909 RepID=R7UE84_CAPTE|nr:hypothetical protein CAPTEDRAFT_199895 [Capitella teleta]|eukprot:ELU04396.1 hypothetical protein CAPTEDRAFT_199895 [Capitella teleta]